MKCPRCLNTNESLFYEGSKGIYCRACVQFKRQLILEEIHSDEVVKLNVNSEVEIKFELTSLQKRASAELARLVKAEDVLLEAVCGAGKTEIMIQSIQEALEQGKKVAVAIARRQVVIELAERFQEYFKKCKVIAVCEGFTEIIDGDLIVCTTHQLYRYPNTFDLLIMDEPDAFPYKGNKVLEGIAKTSCKGKMIYSTATPSLMMKNLKSVSLNRRPHGYPLIVPEVKLLPKFLLYIELIWKMKKTDKQTLIFVPTIKYAEWFGLLFKQILQVEVCTSKTEKKELIIKKFKDKEVQFLICTTILERGVTFENIDVIVFMADHIIFDESSLIQISGRVGRSIKYPTGECSFLCSSKSEAVKICLERIMKANEMSLV